MNTTKDEAIKTLSAWAEEAVDLLASDVPDRNCSCHISPPCNDCVEWSRHREVVEKLRAALAATSHITPDAAKNDQIKAQVWANAPEGAEWYYPGTASYLRMDGDRLKEWIGGAWKPSSMTHHIACTDCSWPRPVAPDAAAIQAESVEITLGNGMWHTNCTNHFGGPMKEVAQEPTRSIMECVSCGKRGYYPVGGVGRVCSVEAASPAIAPEASELPSSDSPAAFAVDFAAIAMHQQAPVKVAGLGRITNEDDGFLTLQFKDEDAAQAFMQNYEPSVDCREMPDMHRAAAATDDRELRGKVGKALGLEDGGKFAWSYLISLMESATAFCDKVESEQAAAEPVPTSKAAKAAYVKLTNSAQPTDSGGAIYIATQEMMRAFDAHFAATKPAASEAVGVEPYAYSYECKQPFTEPEFWAEFITRNQGSKPEEGAKTRNVRSLYLAAPAAPTDAKKKPDFSKCATLEEYKAQMAAWGAPTDAQNLRDALTGLTVSMDVSTGDEDGTNRIFGLVEGVQEGTDGRPIVLAVEESRNFAAPTDARFNNVWNEALEEAALVAEDTDIATQNWCGQTGDDGSQTRSDIADAIRALKSSPQAPKTEGSE